MQIIGVQSHRRPVYIPVRTDVGEPRIERPMIVEDVYKRQGVFLETAHPAKFKDTVEKIIGEAVEIPAKLQAFMRGEKNSLPMSKDFADFKQYLMHV